MRLPLLALSTTPVGTAGKEVTIANEDVEYVEELTKWFLTALRNGSTDPDPIVHTILARGRDAARPKLDKCSEGVLRETANKMAKEYYAEVVKERKRVAKVEADEERRHRKTVANRGARSPDRGNAKRLQAMAKEFDM